MSVKDSKDVNDLDEINIPGKRSLKSKTDNNGNDKIRDSRNFSFKCDLKGIYIYNPNPNPNYYKCIRNYVYLFINTIYFSALLSLYPYVLIVTYCTLS